MPPTRIVRRSTVEFLSRDYDVLRDLLVRYGETSPAEPEKQRVLLARIREELEFHLRIEQSLFYPALARAVPAESRERIRAAEQEHRVVTELLAGLLHGSTRQETVVSLTQVLSGHLERLAERDRREVFPLAMELRSETLGRLLEEMQTLRGRLENGLER